MATHMQFQLTQKRTHRSAYALFMIYVCVCICSRATILSILSRAPLQCIAPVCQLSDVEREWAHSHAHVHTEDWRE